MYGTSICIVCIVYMYIYVLLLLFIHMPRESPPLAP